MAVSSVARAADRYWVGPDQGLWSDGANWSSTYGGAGGAGAPISGNAYLRRAGAFGTSRTVRLDMVFPIVVNTPGGTSTFAPDSVVIEDTLVGGMALSQAVVFRSTGSITPAMHARLEVVGLTGRGTHNHSAGPNEVGTLRLGVNAGSAGTYNLSGGSISGYTVEVGVDGSGTFGHTGGSITLQNDPSTFLESEGWLRLGAGTGAGTYNLSGGGSLSIPSESIGYNGTGIFNQSGGSNSANSITLGVRLASFGTYNLSGGTLSANYLTVGGGGSGGTFRHTGGLAQIPYQLIVGDAASGRYEISGSADLRTPLAYVGHDTYYNATGTVEQSGGSADLDTLLVGYLSPGTYRLGGTGTLQSSAQRVGYYDQGIFQQTGGSNDVTGLYLGDGFGGGSGTYRLSGGALTADSGRIGDGTAGTGLFEQSGGTSSFVDLTIWPASTYSLSGGTLTTSGVWVINRGIFRQTGGVADLAGDINTFNYDEGVVVVGLEGGPAAQLSTKSITQMSLSIGSAGRVNLKPADDTSSANRLRTLSLAAGGVLDLNNHNLVLDYDAGDPSPADEVLAWLRAGFDGGTWNGSGIISSAAANDPLSVTAIGWADNADLGLSSFDDVPADETALLLMYTYGGDANFDGLVSGDDYTAIDFAIAIPGAFGWINGDFNYDGFISGDDYTIIDFNIAAQGDPFSLSGSVADSNRTSAVPEPSACGVAGLVAAALLARRRRRRCAAACSMWASARVK